MLAVLAVAGPGVKKGERWGQMRSIEVAGLVLKLLAAAGRAAH
jgi:hypothetical protein